MPFEIVFRNNTTRDKYSMKMAYDNKQLIKHKISNLQKIHSLQIISMDYIVKILFNLQLLYIWILIKLTSKVENFISMTK